MQIIHLKSNESVSGMITSSDEIEECTAIW